MVDFGYSDPLSLMKGVVVSRGTTLSHFTQIF